MMMTHINALDAPFVFLWRKESWQPWSWRLYSLDQAQLEIPSDINF